MDPAVTFSFDTTPGTPQPSATTMPTWAAQLLPTKPASAWTTILGALATVSMVASGYHGYKRHNDSIGWAIGWGALGAFLPVLTPTVAFFQGFGKPMKK